MVCLNKRIRVEINFGQLLVYYAFCFQTHINEKCFWGLYIRNFIIEYRHVICSYVCNIEIEKILYFLLSFQEDGKKWKLYHVSLVNVSIYSTISFLFSTFFISINQSMRLSEKLEWKLFVCCFLIILCFNQ